MRLHLIGVAGAFMVGLARLARDMGHEVSGSDRAFYPPMGDEAKRLGISLFADYDGDCDSRPADLYIVGNAISRGNPLMESVLRRRRPYVSGPQWLSENVLQKRTVLAVAGTHGKTTTSSLLIHILERAGKMPGFLLGGAARNFGVSARLSPDSEWFVIEADEYDTAFFDKRPKFLHYHPQIALLNNLEFDHADIYPNVEAIARQFHYFLRLLPDNGKIIARANDANVADVFRIGAYSPVEWFGGRQSEWRWQHKNGAMTVIRNGDKICQFSPPLPGAANRDNILAAVAMAAAAGADPAKTKAHLEGYLPPLRRMQQVAAAGGVRVFDDFAHHPTAMQKTIAALKEARPRRGQIIAVFEPRSNSMKAGVFSGQMATALAAADVIVAPAASAWLREALAPCPQPVFLEKTAKAIVSRVIGEASAGDDILIMSNSDFDGLAKKLTAALEERQRNR